MKKILVLFAAAAMIGAAHAQTAKPAAAAPKGPTADEKARDRAVANYKKNKGIAMGDEKPMAMDAKAAAKKKK